MMGEGYGGTSGRPRGDLGYCCRRRRSRPHPGVLRHDPTASHELVASHHAQCSLVARRVVDHVLRYAISHSWPEGTLGAATGFQTARMPRDRFGSAAFGVELRFPFLDEGRHTLREVVGGE